MTEGADSGTPGGRTPAPDANADSFSLLVVDDSEANRDVLCRRLRRSGYRVTAADDGTEALALLERGPFDLVLLDVMMPGLNGLEVLRIIRQGHPATQLPVIMATAKNETEDVVRALELGASDYVTKPLDFAVVLARVRTQLALKRSVEQVLELEARLSQRNAELETSNARMRRDLEAAAKVQATCLPKSLPAVPGLNFAWAFHPCESLAGDFLNVCPLDDDHVGLYVLDVSGHGVAAALLAVTLSRVLSPAADPDSLLLRGKGAPGEGVVAPAEVADRLAHKFPWDETTEQFFTIVYGVLNVRTRQFRYVSAGHPGVAYLRRGSRPEILRASGFPVGLGAGYEEQTLVLGPGDRLYLYSDGVTEAMSPDGEQFGGGRLLQTLERDRPRPLRESISLLLEGLRRWCGDVPFRDDISVLAVEAV
jgi:sigma-B regulation protein RsbU (phosphoserine phosphatase)